MKKISISEYRNNMGVLIDVRHPLDYKEENHHPESINVYADKLIYSHKNYLDINKKYFITCTRGTLSRRVVRSLEILGYDVTVAI